MAKEDPYPNTWTGSGVARNVVGAIGGFLGSGGDNVDTRNRNLQGWSSRNTGTVTAPSGGGGTRPAVTGTGAFPGMLRQRSGNTTGESTGSRSTNNSPRRASMPSILPQAQNLTGRPLNVSGNAVVRTSAQARALPMTANNQRRAAGLNPVIRTSAQARALPVTANNQRVRGVNAQGQQRLNASGNPIIRNSAQARALPVTPNRQRAADAAAAKPALSSAQDPYNWAGIARDLGNAGDVRYASHRTGALASSSAKSYVAQRQSQARTNARNVNVGRSTGPGARRKTGGTSRNKAV